MHPETSPLIELSNVNAKYRGQNVIENVSLSVRPGDFLAIIGPNGSGKTTLLKIILGLMQPSAGQRVKAAGAMAYVPQRMALNPLLRLTVEEFFALKGEKSRIEEMLEDLDLMANRRTPLLELSGGLLQKTFVGFALLRQPSLLCLDEATEGLDLKAQKSFFDFLARFVSSGPRGLIFVSHDVSAISSHATRVICMNRRVLYDGDPRSPHFHSCLHKIYGEESHIHDHRDPH